VLDADAAPPIGIVGTGLDVVYPRRNGPLWRQVADRGLLVSEYPLGTGPTAWRFPARNRLIAAIADVVVVVESHESGGALHTVEEAFTRGRPVMAVPGPVRSNPSKGSNRLLADGAQVCRDALDVVTLLGLDHGALKRGPAPVVAEPTGPGATVLDAIGWQPSATEELLLRTGLPLGELARHLDELEEQGWVTRRGGWFERVARTSS
jgi:DNA processing protein